MRGFHCDCGNPVFFDNETCLSCGRRLGFDSMGRTMRALTAVGGGLWESADGQRFRFCDNGDRWGVCNWLRPGDTDHPLCWGCQFNRTVPNQSQAVNRLRWLVLERAKKRLLYTLLQLELPLVNGWDDPRTGLLLDFIEDQRSNAAYPETFVTTGFLGGVITINALEADDVARMATQGEVGEAYRTVLGHLRHESGHYYWSRLDADPDTRARFAEVFGDPDADYGAALARYYEGGPQPGWQDSYISAYASAHPSEDWAECWGHYLHIHDALDTAAAHGLLSTEPATLTMARRVELWRHLATVLNELNRSIGHGDAYPFTINAAVAAKLEFVDEFMGKLRRLS